MASWWDDGKLVAPVIVVAHWYAIAPIVSATALEQTV